MTSGHGLLGKSQKKFTSGWYGNAISNTLRRFHAEVDLIKKWLKYKLHR